MDAGWALHSPKEDDKDNSTLPNVMKEQDISTFESSKARMYLWAFVAEWQLQLEQHWQQLVQLL